ncbi:SH3 domain-binding glutamic acid-rich protein homolog isoform X2 [Dendroctonus ponderosae]|uniref:SH3 domain-binding glutamic acid-rich protein homolog n=1 Tax=Dendroctonus ponderosae TaxID=77166 RepID=A0AAR5PR48_DENPD|nr:SH3 domain-binding glutamic acid-rich protein homolog isoform X2 [Dendroctonus ponderosae]
MQTLVKKRQQRVTLILDSKSVTYDLLDIAEPNMEEAKEYMQTHSKLMGCTISDPNPRHPLPPQIFNDDEYCGDYDAFDMANEVDEMDQFLKLAPSITSNAEVKLGNGDVQNEDKSKEPSPEKEGNELNGPEAQENGEEEAPKEKSATPQNEKSPSPQKEKSPSPQKEKSPSPAVADGEDVKTSRENNADEAETED